MISHISHMIITSSFYPIASLRGGGGGDFGSLGRSVCLEKTFTLFKIQIVHFAIPFKTRGLILWPWFVSFSYKIM